MKRGVASRLVPLRLFGLALGCALAAPGLAQDGAATETPRLVTKDGRHALLVDGTPFLILGAQANNSSNYAAALPRVWPMLDRLHANTLEMPVSWEQIEPVEGRFDFTFVQTLLDEARKHDKRLILLWFGTWKNTGASYQPAWVKLDNRRFPRMKKRDGSDHGVHSPHGAATLAADKKAFVALMTYLRGHDAQNTVILVQPENEVGSYGNPRDYSATADRLFAQPIPDALARALRKPRATWAAAFGAQADRAFNSWYTARYVDEIAAAGKKIKNIPMYVNASLSDPFATTVDPNGLASGGPQQDVIDIWKAAAPAIDFAAPDIYERRSRQVAAYLDGYKRADNALMVPEIGNAREYARYFWATLGRGGIGFAPFGMDDTDYYNYPLGAATLDEATVAAFARNYGVFAGMARDWARIAYERPTWGVARPDDGSPVATEMGDWAITASFGEWQFGFKQWTWIKTAPPPWASEPIGGAIVAQLSRDEFLITGDHVRLSFAGAKGSAANALIVRVEEGRYRDGKWVMERVWNGDQTDYGINFVDRPVWLKVTMGRYR
jgi:beta-galactosidase GanA